MGRFYLGIGLVWLTMFIVAVVGMYWLDMRELKREHRQRSEQDEWRKRNGSQ